MQMGRPIVPQEHGAWAVIYGAFLVGVGVAGRVTPPVLLFLVGVTAIAFANGPLTILARPAAGPARAQHRRHALGWLLAYVALAGLAFAPLLLHFRMTFLLPFGAGATVFLLLRAFLIRGREDRSLLGELVGMGGLTMVGAAAHAVAVGQVQRIGAVLWLLLFLFFASGVFYVRMRIHGMVTQRKGKEPSANPSRWPCLMYHVLLLVVIPVLVVIRVIPWPALLAFAPALWRAAASLEAVALCGMRPGLRPEEAPLSIRRLGWSEVALAAAFVVLLITAFRLPTSAG